jgi:hypothetical protein
MYKEKWKEKEVTNKTNTPYNCTKLIYHMSGLRQLSLMDNRLT